MAVASPYPDEVPEALRRLVRGVMRAFYSVEQCVVVDMLIYTTILREEELADRLQLDKRQVRQLLTSLKTDKLVRTRMRIETDSEGKTSRSNYYYIDYRLFVNVVKFKLDVMRRRLESAQRETTSRYSFRCPECQKTFTDMDVQHLYDQSTDSLLCTHCGHEVEEEEDKAGLADARALMLKYHEQVRRPVDDMLQKCELLHLSTQLQEPEIRAPLNGSAPGDGPGSAEDTRNGFLRGHWSDKSRGVNFGAAESSVTVSFGDDGDDAAEAGGRSGEQRPVWLRESTVEGAATSADSVTQVTQQMAPGRAPGLNFAPTEDGSASRDEIMATLLLHEKRTARPSAVGRARNQPQSKAAAAAAGSSSDGDDSDGSGDDSDDDGVPTAKRSRRHGDHDRDDWRRDGDMDYDEEESDSEDGYVISFKGNLISYESVTQDMIGKMTPAEKEEYIEVGKRWYSDNFE